VLAEDKVNGRRRRALFALSCLFVACVCVAAPGVCAFAQGESQTSSAAPPAADVQGREQQGAETIDAAALILEVARRAKASDRRRYDYTWITKHTERERNRRGEVTKETVEVYETYPVRGQTVKKLISKNGVPVSREQAERELRRAMQALERAERAEAGKAGAQASPPANDAPADASGITSFGPASGFVVRKGLKTSELYVALWRFLRAGEFYAPRRERFRERDAVVLDFRPRADFRPVNSVEQPYAKLCGTIWIDAAERAVMRLEAWPAPGQKAARTGSATRGEGGATRGDADDGPPVVYEQTRLPDGMWLESLVRIKTISAPDVFNGISVDYIKEITDFRRFATIAGDVLETPEKP
jgi:hypothetical protein